MKSATVSRQSSAAAARVESSATSVVNAVILGVLTPTDAQAQLWTMPPGDVSSAVLDGVSKGTLTLDAARVLLEPAPRGRVQFSMKVSEKGAITFRGVPGTHHSFGLTLYGKTIEFLFSHKEEIEQFIAANRETLSWEKAKS